MCFVFYSTPHFTVLSIWRVCSIVKYKLRVWSVKSMPRFLSMPDFNSMWYFRVFCIVAFSAFIRIPGIIRVLVIFRVCSTLEYAVLESVLYSWRAVSVLILQYCILCGVLFEVTWVLSDDVWTKAAAESNQNKSSSRVSCRLCLSSYQHNTSSLVVNRPYANKAFSLLADQQRGNSVTAQVSEESCLFCAHLMFCSEASRHATQSVPGEASFSSSGWHECVFVSHLQPSFSAELCSARTERFTVNSVPTRAAGLRFTSLTSVDWPCLQSRVCALEEQSDISQGKFISYWRELFRLVFVVNSWVYLGDRRHFVIVKHQTENAEQVLLFLWHKRGWFWPLPSWWCAHLHACV